MMPPDSAEGLQHRILVVEDEYLVADFMTELLGDLNYAVAGPVSTIPEAIKIIASERLDAALLDANLRGMSSTPIAARLAASGVPFAVVTGYGGLDLADPVLSNAPRIQKPFTSEDVAVVLTRILL